MLKFIYSEKATKFCEIFTLLLTGTTYDKSKVKIFQNFVVFSKNMNFRTSLPLLWQTPKKLSVEIVRKYIQFCWHQRIPLVTSPWKSRDIFCYLDLISNSNLAALLSFRLYPSIRKRVLCSGMLLYLHHRNSKLFFHPEKFDIFKDEKISDYKTVSVSQSKNLLDWKLLV